MRYFGYSCEVRIEVLQISTLESKTPITLYEKHLKEIILFCPFLLKGVYADSSIIL